MRFATLGDDTVTARAARRLVANGQIWVAAADLPTAAKSELPGNVERLDHWEDLLHLETVDWVLVATRSDESRDAALRKLAQTKLPLLMVHPACEPVLAIEMEMTREGEGEPISTLVAAAHHPAFQEMQRLMDPAEALGKVEQVVFERRLPERDASSVLEQLRYDCELIRELVGRVRHVNAMGESGKGASFANLSVNMTSFDDVVVRWSVSQGDGDGHLALLGQHGEANLVMNSSEWRLTVPGRDSQSSEPDAGLDLAIDRFADALDNLTESPGPAWSDVRHSLEIAEAGERSAIKGKTIELLDEAYTEESSFKGLMAMGGCGLLLLTLLFMIVWSVVEGVRLPYKRSQYEAERIAAIEANEISPDDRPSDKEHDWPLALRLWPVYPLALFLMLQTLRFVFAKPKLTEEAATRNEGAASLSASDD